MNAYIGTYSRNGSVGIYHASFESGKLTITGETPAPNPSWLTVSGSHLYAVGEADKGTVASYAIAPDGSLLFINDQPSGGVWPCHIAERDGILYAANYGSGSVGIFSVDAGGRILPGDFIQYMPEEGHPHPHAHQCVFTPGGEFMAAADLGTDRVIFYPYDALRHSVILPGQVVRLPNGAGPRHVAFGKDGAWYVIGELSSEVFSYQGYGDTAKPTGRHSLLATPAAGNAGSAMRLSPDGKLALCAVRGENTLILLPVANDGTLSVKTIHVVGGDCPRDAVFSPDGQYVLTACQKSNEIIVFKLNASDQRLSEVSRLAIGEPTCICFID